MYPDLRPAVQHVPASPERFAGDTLLLALTERRLDYWVRPSGSAPVMRASCASLGPRAPFAPEVWDAIGRALTGTLQAAFPAAVVVQTTIDTSAAPRRVVIAASLVGVPGNVR
jgi:hypothetical protein